MRKFTDYIANSAIQNTPINEYYTSQPVNYNSAYEDPDSIEDNEDADKPDPTSKKKKTLTLSNKKGRTLTGQPISQINIRPKLDNQVLFYNSNPLREQNGDKHAVISWGRMNPVTSGHEKLVNKVHEVAKQHSADPHIFLSRTHDKKKNPLPYTTKHALARKAFGNVVKATPKKEATIIGVMKHLHSKGYGHVTMVAGSDRVDEYKRLLHKYNGPDSEYNFKSIHVVSAGHRDPDADGAEGMSGTKLRDLAKRGNHDEFQKGLPSGLRKHSKTVLGLVRKHLGEEVDYEDLQEVLNVQQRLRKAARIRMLKQKLRLGRKRAIQRKASRPTLMVRSRRLALRFMRARILRNRKYSDLSLAAREALDRRIKAKAKVISRLANRLLPRVAQAENRRKIGSAFRSPGGIGMGIPQGGARASNRPIHPGQRYNTLHNSVEIDQYINVITEAYNKLNHDFGPNSKEADTLLLKSVKTNIPYEVLEEVYVRGKIAYNDLQEDNNLSASQHAFNRVNSFINGGAARQMDGDLWEEGGAGYQGTDQLVKKYKKDTPGQNVSEEKKVKNFKTYMQSCSEAINAPHDPSRSTKLDISQAESMRKSMAQSWDMIQGHHLQKKFLGKDYVDIEIFVKEINRLSAELDHFPEVSNFYNEATVKIGTTDVDGLTAIDFTLAGRIDQVAARLKLKDTIEGLQEGPITAGLGAVATGAAIGMGASAIPAIAAGYGVHKGLEYLTKKAKKAFGPTQKPTQKPKRKKP